MRMDITSGILNNIHTRAMDAQTVNGEQAIYNSIKSAPNSKEQLMKTAQEFESIFITKMMSLMDNMVDKEGSLFEEKSGGYLDSFKPYMYQQIGHDLASKPNTSFGLAKMIYNQMEKFVDEG